MLTERHSFYGGTYYEDVSTKEIFSVEEALKRKMEEERRREEKIQRKKCEHYVFIQACENMLNGNEASNYNLWNGYDLDVKKPKGIAIISDNEYIKNDKRECYYRKHEGNYLFPKIVVNKKLPIEKVQEIHGFFLCSKKGTGILYTKEQLFEKILNL